jgi:uncharacterized membrane protein YphA (DoxX/SURF4 family)
MKALRILYWVITIVFCAFLIRAGINKIIREPVTTAVFRRLHLPLYLMNIIGSSELMGAVTLLIPLRKYPNLKVAAYANFTFLLGSATTTHLYAGDSIAHAAVPFIMLLMNLAGYWLWVWLGKKEPVPEGATR